MNKSTFTILSLVMVLTAGCAINGESYTDEGANHAVVVEKSSSTGSVDLPEASGELPEIAAYDEPEIPPLDAPATE